MILIIMTREYAVKCAIGSPDVKQFAGCTDAYCSRFISYKHGFLYQDAYPDARTLQQAFVYYWLVAWRKTSHFKTGKHGFQQSRQRMPAVASYGQPSNH